MDKVERTMKRVKEHYEHLEKEGYEIVFLALQGSQNYELDIYDEDYISDVDTKAVILPSFKDFVYNRKPVSETLVLENNEHIDVKDIRVMIETYKKQNINFIETLFSKFIIINPKYQELIKPLFQYREDIAHLNVNQALRCMAGMSMEKLKALEHPYPTIKDKIDKFGYDPKQLHHIFRMNDFIRKYASGKKYEECLIPDNKDFLISIKKGIFSLENARVLAKGMDMDTRKIKDDNVEVIDIVNKKAIEVLEQVKYDVLKQKFKEDIVGG